MRYNWLKETTFNDVTLNLSRSSSNFYKCPAGNRCDVNEDSEDFNLVTSFDFYK